MGFGHRDIAYLFELFYDSPTGPTFPRVFVLFFNRRQPHSWTKAMALAWNKQSLTFSMTNTFLSGLTSNITPLLRTLLKNPK